VQRQQRAKSEETLEIFLSLQQSCKKEKEKEANPRFFLSFFIFCTVASNKNDQAELWILFSRS